MFLDGFHLKVRLARRVVAVPVLAVLGVTETGEKRLVALRLAVSEAAALWNAVLRDLAHRGLPAPVLVVMDGAAGLKEVRDVWPAVRVQRCTTHKWRNLESHCPVHARAELKRDYDRILYATDGLAARATYDAFVKKWTTLCPPVARSLEEAGLELLTFYDFPKAMWKSLRTTNALENLHREFRRRTKTQASFGTEDAALTLPRISDLAMVLYRQDKSPGLDFWGSDVRSHTTEGDTQWVNYKPSPFSSPSMAF